MASLFQSTQAGEAELVPMSSEDLESDSSLQEVADAPPASLRRRLALGSIAAMALLGLVASVSSARSRSKDKPIFVKWWNHYHLISMDQMPMDQLTHISDECKAALTAGPHGSVESCSGKVCAFTTTVDFFINGVSMSGGPNEPETHMQCLPASCKAENLEKDLTNLGKAALDQHSEHFESNNVTYTYSVDVECGPGPGPGPGPGEMSKVMIYFMEGPPPEELLDSKKEMKKFTNGLFKIIDADKSGDLNKEEGMAFFMGELPKMGKTLTDEEQQFIMKHVNDDGLFKTDEFNDVMTMLARDATGESQSALVRHINEKEDEIVVDDLLKNPPELKKFANKLFKQIDTDKSGHLSYDEMKTAFEDMHEEGIITRMPTPEEEKHFIGIAGDDKKLQVNEFTDIVHHVLEALVEHHTQ